MVITSLITTSDAEKLANPKHFNRLRQQQDLQFLHEVSSVPLQQGLRHLQTAFTRIRLKAPVIYAGDENQRLDLSSQS
uniref:hypothetical protein n=1 Tax=Microseira wollei TaxID=467598 RepID=UPI001CFED1AF|nr:hypothetical protein [Microseira wollei]